MNRAADYLAHVREAASQACQHVSGMTESEFLSDAKTQQAVVFNLIVLGEAATKLAAAAPDWVRQHPQIPWVAMRGMRNRLAHGYFEINWPLVWTTVQRELLALLSQLDAVQPPL